MQPIELKVVSAMLGVSRTKVRAWCRSGVLPAVKLGDSVYVDESRLAAALSRSRSKIHARRLEYATSLIEIESLDLKEIWIPDIVRFADQLSDRFDLITEAEERLEKQRFSSAAEIEIPKTIFFARTGHLLTLQDRLNYHVTVRSFAEKVDSLLPEVVFSSRLDRTMEPRLLKQGVWQWKRWGRYVRRQVRQGNDWLIKTDLASYFATMQHGYLFDDLRAIEVGDATLKTLEIMLGEWGSSAGQGLIQGPDVSRILGNFYLLPVDRAMLDAGYMYSRYMDDVRIVANSRSGAVAAMKLFERECKKRGLIASSQKTSMLHGQEALRVDLNEMRDHIAYLFDIRRFRQAKPLLRAMLRRELAKQENLSMRDAKFSLYRLSRTRDGELLAKITERFDELSPIAPILAEYLSHFLRTATVQNAIGSYLHSDDNNKDPYFMYYLFALIMEYPPDSIDQSWIDLARKLGRDKNQPEYLRIISANLMAHKRDPVSLSWIRRELNAESESMLRGYLVALARGGQLDTGTLKRFGRRSNELYRLTEYLRSSPRLPSLIHLHSDLFRE